MKCTCGSQLAADLIYGVKILAYFNNISVNFNCCCGYTSLVHGYSSKINQVDLICKWQRSLTNFCGHIIFRWTHKVQFVLHLFFYHMLHVTSMRILYVSFFIFFYPLSLQHYCSLRWYVSGQISWWHTNFHTGNFFNYFLSDQISGRRCNVFFFQSIFVFFFFIILNYVCECPFQNVVPRPLEP